MQILERALDGLYKDKPMKPCRAAAVASVVRYGLRRAEIDLEIIILMVVALYPFRRCRMALQMVANRTTAALSLCHTAALALVVLVSHHEQTRHV